MSQVESLSVISCAIQGLQKCGDKRAQPYLEQIVQNHEDQRIRDLAQQALILGRKLHVDPYSNDYILRLLPKGEPWDIDTKDLIMKMFWKMDLQMSWKNFRQACLLVVQRKQIQLRHN